MVHETVTEFDIFTKKTLTKGLKGIHTNECWVKQEIHLSMHTGRTSMLGYNAR